VTFTTYGNPETSEKKRSKNYIKKSVTLTPHGNPDIAKKGGGEILKSQCPSTFDYKVGMNGTFRNLCLSRYAVDMQQSFLFIY
jgi:hypothetical protein